MTGSVGQSRLFPRGAPLVLRPVWRSGPALSSLRHARPPHRERLAESRRFGALARVLQSWLPDFSLAGVRVPCFLVVICFRVSFRLCGGRAGWRGGDRGPGRFSPGATLRDRRPRAACFPFLLKLLKSGFLCQMPPFSDVTSI